MISRVYDHLDCFRWKPQRGSLGRNEMRKQSNDMIKIETEKGTFSVSRHTEESAQIWDHEMRIEISTRIITCTRPCRDTIAMRARWDLCSSICFLRRARVSYANLESAHVSGVVPNREWELIIIRWEWMRRYCLRSFSKDKEVESLQGNQWRRAPIDLRSMISQMIWKYGFMPSSSCDVSFFNITLRSYVTLEKYKQERSTAFDDSLSFEKMLLFNRNAKRMQDPMCSLSEAIMYTSIFTHQVMLSATSWNAAKT